MNESPRRRPSGVSRLLGVCALAISVTVASCTVLAPRPDPSRFFVLLRFRTSLRRRPGSTWVRSVWGRSLSRATSTARRSSRGSRRARSSQQFSTIGRDRCRTSSRPCSPRICRRWSTPTGFKSTRGTRGRHPTWWSRRRCSVSSRRPTVGQSSWPAGGSAKAPPSPRCAAASRHLSRPLSSTDAEVVAAALSGLLDDFSRELADAILAARA